LEDDELARRLGEDGYVYIKEKFDWETLAGQLLDIYERVLS
jgi:glycosyltransferase involved in cell wall biosynthesis